MFKKILIANRGDVALRVLRACREMNIPNVVVHSTADADSMPVRLADESVCIGPPSSAESYLNVASIITAAGITGADAVHPGVGFLAENADFAEIVAAHGLTFIGPEPRHIRSMGDKVEAKITAADSGLPLVPGSPGAVHTLDEARTIGADVGYPLLVKAASGGGGRGMKVAETADDLAEAFSSARSEAKAAFGDDTVYLERYLGQPRHIEVQVIADSHGNVVHLGERECSIQRRHQKVVEEAPSPFISPETRAAMGEQAVELARAVGYRSAGTVEFIVGADQDFYFLEMNTRLQVEHPVTEMVYGLDLVEKMIRIAAGEELGLTQDDIKADGWAVEARVYAEDPARGFLPSIGQLVRYREPAGEGVRVDSGVDEGGEISMYYDPMIAKLVAHAPTREAAIDRLHLALDHYEIDGIVSNRQFLSAVLENGSFRCGDLTTGFIDAEFEGDFVAGPPSDAAAARLVALGTAIVALQMEERHAGDPDTGFVVISQDGARRMVELGHVTKRSAKLTVDGKGFTLLGLLQAPVYLFDGTINEEPVAVQIRHSGHKVVLTHGAARLALTVLPARFEPMLDHMPVAAEGAGADEITAPMPGQITRILVEVGDEVVEGQDVAIIEAMKMENVLSAEARGTVREVAVKIGDNLNVDDLILALDLAEDG